MRLDCGQGVFLVVGLREQEGMELVHEPVVERREIFQRVRARFLQALEEEDL